MAMNVSVQYNGGFLLDMILLTLQQWLPDFVHPCPGPKKRYKIDLVQNSTLYHLVQNGNLVQNPILYHLVQNRASDFVPNGTISGKISHVGWVGYTIPAMPGISLGYYPYPTLG